MQTLPLTPREEQALSVLIAYRVRRGMSPSSRDLAAHLGVCNTRAYQLLKRLIKKGFVIRLPCSARTWVPIDRFGAPIG